MARSELTVKIQLAYSSLFMKTYYIFYQENFSLKAYSFPTKDAKP